MINKIHQEVNLDESGDDDDDDDDDYDNEEIYLMHLRKKIKIVFLYGFNIV